MSRRPDSAPGAGFNRRHAMALMGGALTAGLSAGAARAAAPAAGSPPAAAPVIPGFNALATEIHTELKELAPNVFAFLQREAKGQSNLSVSNFGCVVGPRSMFAVDAGGGPQHARNFLAATRRFGKPFDRIVITHEHPDHIVGLSQFPEGIEVIAQEATREQMTRMRQSNTPGYWATNAAWGRPDDVNRLILPSVTYKDRMSLYYGDIEVQLIWPGPAHTSGDTLVKLPREKVLFMSDIAFFDVTPLNASGYMADWIKVCEDVLKDPSVEIIVPGHGPAGGKPELQAMLDYLKLLVREGRKKYDAGISAGRAAADIDLGRYANWTDVDRIAPNMARLYAEFAGTIATGMDRAATAQAVAEYNQLKKRP